MDDVSWNTPPKIIMESKKFIVCRCFFLFQGAFFRYQVTIPGSGVPFFLQRQVMRQHSNEIENNECPIQVPFEFIGRFGFVYYIAAVLKP